MVRGSASESKQSDAPPKPVIWLGDSLERLREFPEDVKDDIGAAIFWAQKGAKHPDAKALSGQGSAGVVEVIENYDGDTYRAVYTVEFAGKVYVLHCFQKKSKEGKKTPRPDLELIRKRYKDAERLESLAKARR